MRKKNAYIATIYDPYPNYGNKLQNYAVQEVLRKFNLNVKTIVYEKDVWERTKFASLKFFIQSMTDFRFAKNVDFWKFYMARVKAFNDFSKRNILTVDLKSFSEMDKEADYFVVGSDQVWNPEFYFNSSVKKELFLLSFTNSEKKICFSPSFGIEKLPDDWRDWFQKNLLSFPNISVRERAGAEIVYGLTGKKAEVLIDPTLMLDKEQWSDLAEKPAHVDCEREYMLTYFLGKQNERAIEKINQYQEKGYKVYKLLDKNDRNLYITNPAHFIYLINHAKMVLTDSFHACVFSFIFEKPFIVFSRDASCGNMMSRIHTLLGTFNLERKYADSGIDNDEWECDYSIGKERLYEERNKVMSFLEKSFNRRDK